MANKFYVILDNERKEALLVESSRANSAKRTMRSRFANGFYRNKSSKFARFQEAFGRGMVELEDVGVSHRVFAEEKLRGRGYRVLSEGDLEDVKYEYASVRVPVEYVDNVKALVGQLQERDGKK